ncbi:Wzz/FepE/Etk N-terminal domain-containing protein [Azohydromonas lata]|uniref:Wzz/FepE/Etk N-terminal domain-containing protein n=1 Tax=Azohydromonas lata TaxID=45677 RepID=A0ABU5IC80_9BURK|nr:Wzz/FepE/Etk N-terminal domain-containing protein [Azohydromonas lata]MDZ5456547.1 Wzz/FepE/Etk N-terminal domain-containing protein [Azohydromonas lata]
MRADEAAYANEDDEGLGLLDLALPLAQSLKQLVVGPLLAGVLALGAAFLITPMYTAKTVIIPPTQSQGGAAAALSSLGALANLAGASVGSVKNPADQYVGLLQSATVADRIIDRFKLVEVYDVKYREDARKVLSNVVHATVGKKDGLITVEVDDHDAQRAAEIANQLVAELRSLSSGLALSEAQQRRAFFEDQLKQTRDNLIAAQKALETSGFNQGAIKAEPQAAAEGYAALLAEITAGEVRLQALRRSLADNAPEVQQTLARLSALRGQLSRLEASTPRGGDADYVSKYREFKYQETLFDLMAKQFEMARLDESHEGALIQVVDPATPPERKSAPKRAFIAIAATLATLLLMASFLIVRHAWRRSVSDPAKAEKINQLRTALRRS